ncbi:MAG: dethiobiotin synthetase [Verrucomicrobiota bacterium]
MRVSDRRRARIIFVTGTDTGVGKTLLTALLLYHFRLNGHRALAIKPFCSGDRKDAILLQVAQDNELDIDQVNPFYFSAPIAPLVAARKTGTQIRLKRVLDHIKKIAAGCEILLIEGAGGLLVPLGENYFVNDLINALKCEVIIVARNSLGTINHTLLTAKILRTLGAEQLRIVLMECEKSDASSITNKDILTELLAPIQVKGIKYLGGNANEISALKNNCKKIKKTLAQLGS